MQQECLREIKEIYIRDVYILIKLIHNISIPYVCFIASDKAKDTK